jgi:alanine racemase
MAAVTGASAPPGGKERSPAGSAPQIPELTLDRPPAAGAWVELHRDAVAANLAAVRSRLDGVPVMGVIKANGYGHGVVPMTRLLTDAGVDALMVITVEEALAARAAGATVPILNYGPFDGRAVDSLVAGGIEQAVYTVEHVAGMTAAARRRGRTARVHVILDTGLGRVGARPERAAEVLDAVAAQVQQSVLAVAGIATALTEDPAYDRVQLRRYLEVCDAARARGIDIGARHVASSAAILDFAEAHLDMVRPGIMLYGHYPNEHSLRERPVELVPALSLRARVAHVKTVPAGDSIGYHRAWVAERETRVATLPVGHSEGYPPGALAAGGAVEIHGRACPLIGGITSNHMEVALPAGLEVAVGDVATLVAGGRPELSGAGRAPESSAAAGRGGDDAGWSPTAPQVGEWGGAGVYGTLMRINPLLPRVLS